MAQHTDSIMLDLLHSHAISTDDPMVSRFLQLGLYFYGFIVVIKVGRPTKSDDVTRIMSIGSSIMARSR